MNRPISTRDIADAVDRRDETQERADEVRTEAAPGEPRREPTTGAKAGGHGKTEEREAVQL